MCQARPDGDDLWGTLVGGLFYLSRVLSLLRTLAIAEYGMDDSIEGTVKEGNRSIMLGCIHR